MSNVSMIDGHIDREERKLTDKEIIKALECCSSPKANCEDCPCFNKDCMSTTPYVLDLINRQQAYIEQLKKDKDRLAVALANAVGRNVGFKEEIDRLQNDLAIFRKETKRYATRRAEAIKGFAERLSDVFYSHDKGDAYVREVVYNLVKEMVGK